MLPGKVKRTVTEERENNQYGERGIIEDNSRQED
jgi:hypothetical protein